MQKTLFFNGQEPIIADLDYNQDSLIDYIKANMSRTFGSGVVTGISGYNTTPYVQNGTSPKTIKILPLIAYDTTGEIIKLDVTLDNLVPATSGDKIGLLSSTGSFANSTTYYIVARYSYYTDTSVTHPVDPDISNDTRKVDFYEFYALTSYLATDVLISKITTDASGYIETIIESGNIDYLQLDGTKVVSTLTGSGVTSYTVTDPVTFNDHINAVGTGTVTAINPHGIEPEDIGINLNDINDHQAKQHATGIVTDNVNSTTSALYSKIITSVNSNTDYIQIYKLSSSYNETALVNGTVITSDTLNTDTRISFIVASTPLAAGWYLIYVDSSTKAITRSSVYATESALVTAMNSNSTWLPICSVQWVLGISPNEPTYYHLNTSSFKDRRIFGNTSVRNVRSETMGALSTGGAVGNRTITFYNALLTSATNSMYMDVKDKSFICSANGSTNSYTFTGLTSSTFLINTDVVTQLNSGMSGAIKAELVDGYITLKATNTLVIGSGTANTIIGFTEGQYDNDLKLKSIDFVGDAPGVVNVSYGTSGVSQVSSKFGNKTLLQAFTYTNSYLTQIVESIIY